VFKLINTFPPDVANVATDFVVEFNQTVPVKKHQGQQYIAAVPRLHNAHIIQVDAGCFPEGFTTYGCVFKADPDDIFFSACKKEELSTDPVMVETLAIRWCLRLSKERGLQDIIIQSDALAVVECFRGSNSLACIALIILDCKALMDEFNSVSIVYISRDLNALAHRLVGYAMQYSCKSWNGYAFPVIATSTDCNSSFI